MAASKITTTPAEVRLGGRRRAAPGSDGGRLLQAGDPPGDAGGRAQEARGQHQAGLDRRHPRRSRTRSSTSRSRRVAARPRVPVGEDEPASTTVKQGRRPRPTKAPARRPRPRSWAATKQPASAAACEVGFRRAGQSRAGSRRDGEAGRHERAAAEPSVATAPMPRTHHPDRQRQRQAALRRPARHSRQNLAKLAPEKAGSVTKLPTRKAGGKPADGAGAAQTVPGGGRGARQDRGRPDPWRRRRRRDGRQAEAERRRWRCGEPIVASLKPPGGKVSTGYRQCRRRHLGHAKSAGEKRWRREGRRGVEGQVFGFGERRCQEGQHRIRSAARQHQGRSRRERRTAGRRARARRGRQGKGTYYEEGTPKFAAAAKDKRFVVVPKSEAEGLFGGRPAGHAAQDRRPTHRQERGANGIRRGRGREGQQAQDHGARGAPRRPRRQSRHLRQDHRCGPQRGTGLHLADRGW